MNTQKQNSLAGSSADSNRNRGRPRTRAVGKPTTPGWSRKRFYGSRPISAGIAVLLLFPLPASQAFYDFAGGEIILDTQLSSGYDSNIFGRSDANDDVFASLAPTLSWIRSSGLSRLNASVGLNVTRYAEFSGQNFEDYFAQVSATFPIPEESDLSGGFNVGHSRNTRLDDFLFDRITTDTFNAGINAGYQLAPRTSLTSSYDYRDSQSGQFTTVTNSGTIGISFAEIARNLDLSFNYRLRHTQLDRRDDERDGLDHAVFANLSGPLLPEQWLPKVTATFSLGYENTIPAAEGERTRRRLTGAAGATWEARERTTVSLTASRDLDLTADQQNVETTSVNLRLGQEIGAKMNANAFTAYSWNDFTNQDRRQETFRAGGGLTRNLNRNWTVGANYSYTHNITNEALREFDRHLITLFTSYVF